MQAGISYVRISLGSGAAAAWEADCVLAAARVRNTDGQRHERDDHRGMR
jgi:hypothetical protein